MTKISSDTIAKLAVLSSLELSNDELSLLEKDLSNILSSIEQLSQLDTENVTPTYQLGGQQNVWREDVIDQPLQRESLLKLAPDVQIAQIKVPKVL